MQLSSPQSPWLGQVIPSLAAALGVPEMSAPFRLPAAESAIVIMVDGLGWELLEQYRGHAPTLRRFLTDPIVLDTCLPSTTAAALTSFATGALPGQTRMVGYSVRRGDGVMNLLHFEEGVDSHSWQPVPTFFTTLRRSGVHPLVVTTPRFIDSGLTKAAFRGATFVGRESLAERFTAAGELAKVPGNLIYLYWSEIDHAGHQDGPGSTRWLHELEEFDRELGLFLAGAPPKILVTLTADHGMVAVEERIDLVENPALAEGVHMIAGEARAVHVHAEPGRAEEVLTRWQDYLEDRALLLPRAEYAAVFGDGPGLDLMGDAVAFALKNIVVVDSAAQSKASIGQRGVHGSISTAETKVPLLVLAAP